ncbi:MAG: mechanosensitive ion channel [Polyangiaceae bacterium]
MRRGRIWVAGVAALCSACGGTLPELVAPDASGPAGHTLTERLAAEAARFDALLRVDVLFKLALLLVVAALLSRMARVLVRLAWRLGLDTQRRLSWWEGGSRVVVGALVLYIASRAALAAAPILSTLLLLALLVASSWVFSSHLQSGIVGIGLLLRRRLRSGDRVQVGGLDGVVNAVGLFNLEIAKADGATALVPNRLLSEQALTVAKEKNSVPVRVRMRFDTAPTRVMIEQARRAALLSPYRAPGSSVDVGRDPADLCVMDVSVQVWAAAAARTAADHLETSLRAALPTEAREGAREATNAGS